MDREPKEHARTDWLAFMEGAVMPGYDPARESADEKDRRMTPTAAKETIPVRVAGRRAGS
jgi:hypothetical protein